MKKFFTISIAILLGSCLSENGVKSGETPTFVRYYYGGNSDAAVTFEETSDKGFIIAATVTVSSSATAARNKIKLIKTDANGNVIWSHVYPDFGSTDDLKSYKASGLQILPADAGYVVVGEDIQQNNTQLLVLTVDGSGKMTNHVSIAPTPNTNQSSLFGKAVAVTAAGNYTILGFAGNSEMVLSELKKTDLSTAWIPRVYEAGSTTLNNRLFLDDVGKIFWSSTVTKTSVTGIRVVKTSPNAQNTDFDLTLLHPNAGVSEEATDFTRFGFGYAIVGSTTAKTDANGNFVKAADKDILFMRLGQDGTILSRHSFTVSETDTQNDVGNSISSTQDGGLILLASVNSVAIDGKGDNDYYLIKINAFGTEEWHNTFGSRFKDTGVAVRQASDGNYVVLGTTNQGNRDIIMLAKTTKVGNINEKPF
jgi:hypothetical protein